MAPKGEAEEAFAKGDPFDCVAANGDPPGCFAANGDSPGFAVAKPLKPPPPEKALKPAPPDATPLAPNGFAGEVDCPDPIAPNPNFPNCGCPGVLGVPNDAPG